MPDLDQERIPPQKTERRRTRERTLRILQSVPNPEEVAALTPGAGDDEARTRDKFEGATAAAIAASAATRGVANLEDLITSVNPKTVSEDSVVFVQGYLTPGDGGGGDFRRVSASSGTEDGGTFFVSEVDDAYAWERITYGQLSPQMFGAVGDGVVDDTEAIQGALDAAPGKGGELVVSSGDYRLTAQLEVSSNTTIRASAGAWFVRDYAGAAPATAYPRALIRNKNFYGPPQATPVTSVPEQTSNIRIYGLGVKTSGSNHEGPGIAFCGVHNLVLEGITVVQTFNSWAITLFAKNARVSNCVVLENQNLYEDGIHVLGGEQIVIENCNITSGDDSLAFGADYCDCFLSDVTVSNCSVDSNKAFGLKVYADAAQTAGSTNIERLHVSGITGKSGNTRNGGVYIKEFGTARGAIRNCVFSDILLYVNSGGSGHDGTNPYGVYLEGGSDLVFSNVKVTGNRSDGALLWRFKGSISVVNCQFEASVAGYALNVASGLTAPLLLRGCGLSSSVAGTPPVRLANTDVTIADTTITTANSVWVGVEQVLGNLRKLTLSNNRFEGSGTTLVSNVGGSSQLLLFSFRGNSCPTNSTVEVGYLSSTSVSVSGNIGTATTDLGSRLFAKTPLILSGSVTHDLGSLTVGATETFTITVTGAAVGDFSIVSYPGFASGLLFTSWISGADTVSVRAVNAGNTTYDHGSSTYTALVVKR